MIFFKSSLNKTILKSVILRRSILLALDSFLILFSLNLSNYFINNTSFSFLRYEIPFYLFFGLIIFIFSGQYKAITKYVGSKLFYTSLLRNFGLLIAVILVSFIDKNLNLNIKILFLNFILLTSFIVGSRLFLRDLINRLNIIKQKKPNVLIYGAGNAGAQLASSIRISGKYKIVGFIDDAPSLIGRELYGIRISSFNDIQKFPDIEHVLIAIPSLNKSSKRKIIDLLKSKHGTEFMLMPISFKR